jgi:GNAT superfamily N-acetyltransferase
MPASIRIARVSDAADLAVLTAQLGYEVEPSALGDRLSRILTRSDQQFVVAEDESRIVGWLHALVVEYVESQPFVAIGGLVVDKSARRQGIGRLLVEYAEKWAREQRCSVVRLWSSAGRTEAHRFYEDLGYAVIKTQYSFAKSLAPDNAQHLSQFVPRIDSKP